MTTRRLLSPIPQAIGHARASLVFLCSLVSFVVDSRLCPINNVTDNDSPEVLRMSCFFVSFVVDFGSQHGNGSNLREDSIRRGQPRYRYGTQQRSLFARPTCGEHLPSVVEFA